MADEGDWLVTSLREGVDPNDPTDAERAMDEAADEIERLRVRQLSASEIAVLESAAANLRGVLEGQIAQKIDAILKRMVPSAQ